jgi:transposase
MTTRNAQFTEDQRSELRSFAKERGRPAAEAMRAQAALVANDKAWDALFAVGVSRSQAYHWKAEYLAHGLESLGEKRTNHRGQVLTTAQLSTVKGWLKNTSPGDHGYSEQFWSTLILADLIGRRFGVAYKSRTSYYLLFKQSSFTWHKPGMHGEAADPAEVAKWRKLTKPLLKRAWGDENTEIFCEDEMILTTQSTTQSVWLPSGESPDVIDTNKQREYRHVYGFLNLKTGAEHAFKFRSQTMVDTADALKQIRAECQGKHILLLWDGARSHTGHAAQDQIKADGNITEHRFPTASPELNPQEHVWKAGRRTVMHNRYIDDLDAATDDLVCHLATTNFPYKLLGFCPGS